MLDFPSPSKYQRPRPTSSRSYLLSPSAVCCLTWQIPPDSSSSPTFCSSLPVMSLALFFERMSSITSPWVVRQTGQSPPSWMVAIAWMCRAAPHLLQTSAAIEPLHGWRISRTRTQRGHSSTAYLLLTYASELSDRHGLEEPKCLLALLLHPAADS